MKTKTKDKKDKAVDVPVMNDKAPLRNSSDLTDSARDEERLQPDTAVLDLPDVEDIPGQEYVQPPTLESYVDDTISSDDEEGVLNEQGPLTSTKKGKSGKRSGDILPGDNQGMYETDDSDDQAIRRARLDDTDDDGDPLNEKGFGEELSGEDLDIPGASDDDDDEAIGEEDEENNSWSLENEKEDDEDQKFE
jgi:hypothetical protein